MTSNFLHIVNIPTILSLFLSFGISFIITYLSVPSIVWISNSKGLHDKPNERTSHNNSIPNLGGIGVFAGLIIASVLFTGQDAIMELKFIMAGLLLLFFIGVKDDVQDLNYRKKFIGQILAICLVVVFGDIRITNFHGLFGIHSIPYILSILFSVFIFLTLINSFNLIDGVDGLASGVAMLVSLIFGTWFFVSGFESYAAMSFSLIGALMAFFRFNVFSKKYKLFLGDTGSMIIGFMISIFAIRFLEYELIAGNSYYFISSPAIVLGILIIPIFDTIRVFFLRLFSGSSPFKADRNHIHHRLLDLGCSHLQTTSILIFVNVVFIVMVLLLQKFGNIVLLTIILSFAIFLNLMLGLLLQKRKKEFTDKYKQLREFMYLKASGVELS